MEKDDEHTQGKYDFGARIYDARLGRWLAIDKKQKQYAGYSPYHFGLNSPLIVIDVNGEENILIVGNDGDNPINFTVFFRKALKEAKTLKKQQSKEKTTILLFVGNLTEEQYAKKMKQATDAGVTIVAVKTSDEVVDYLNNRPLVPKPGGNPKHGGMENDLITDFEYYGHSLGDDLYLSNNMKGSDGKNLSESIGFVLDEPDWEIKDQKDWIHTIQAESKARGKGGKVKKDGFSKNSSAVTASCYSKSFGKQMTEEYTKTAKSSIGFTNWETGSLVWSSGQASFENGKQVGAESSKDMSAKGTNDIKHEGK
jgi:RHS repeat-associated protein